MTKYNLSLGVNYNYRSPRSPISFVKNAICLTHFPVGMKIGQEGKPNIAERIGPGSMRVLGIAANAQDLDILFLESGICSTKRGNLVSSTSGKVEYVEC